MFNFRHRLSQFTAKQQVKRKEKIQLKKVNIFFIKCNQTIKEYLKKLNLITSEAFSIYDIRYVTYKETELADIRLFYVSHILFVCHDQQNKNNWM